MSENRNRDFSNYDSMTTEELEEILRLDAEAPEDGASDVELLLYVMEVLANRRNTNNTGKTALEAWESFQQHYLPEEEHPEYKPKRPRWLRRLTAAAAVIALVVCIPLTANALGWGDLWNVIAKWAKETFSFVSGEDAEVSEPETGDHLEYTSLQDALRSNGLDAAVIPTWIPDGYKFEKIEHDDTPFQEIYIASYISDNTLLRICARSYVASDPERIEINEDLVECYESSNVEYFIFSNLDEIRAIWIIDSYECYISGKLTIEEIKLMIDSIGKG